MTFQRENTLTTKESVLGSKQVGQIIAVPGGRLDKVSLYLEPMISNDTLAENTSVIVEVQGLSGSTPNGTIYTSDAIYLSDITISGFVNFRIEADVPSMVAIILKAPDATIEAYLAWRYVEASSGGEELLLSLDSGATWSANPTKKFAYRAFSTTSNAINSEDQTALIRPGTLETSIDDTSAEFSLATLDRTAVVGDTIAISFGDFVITLVVDQSGSMTWNDRGQSRFDFLKDYIDDFEASLPSGSTASYSLVKFRGRRIGKLDLSVLGTDSGLHFDGVRIVRKTGSPPSDPTDGCVVFEGIGREFVDEGECAPLSSGATYYYSAFSFAIFGTDTLFASGRTDFAIPDDPPRAPVGIAGLEATAVIVDSLGVDLVEGDTDFGNRRVDLSWTNPSVDDATLQYSTITLVRRDDRFPESPIDGTVLLDNVSMSTVSYADDFGGAYDFVNNLTYYYRVFTHNSIGIKSLLPNSLSVSVDIPLADRPWERIEPPGNVPPGGFDVTSPGSPDVSVVESNGEIMLSWVPADSDSKRFKVFYGSTHYPVAKDDKGVDYDGELLYDGTGTEFVHRFLVNKQPHYYVVIALDIVENASAPVTVTIDSPPRIPKPSADATTFFPPPEVDAFSAEVVNDSSIRLRWENPSAPENLSQSFFFGDTVRLLATVDYLDSGDDNSFASLEIVEDARDILLKDDTKTVDEDSAIRFASVPVKGEASVSAVLSVIPIIGVQDLMQSCSIDVHAALVIRNRVTNAVIAQVKTGQLHIAFEHPLKVEVKNEPAQNVSHREWALSNEEGAALAACKEFKYKISSVPGVYVLSGDPFFALVEVTFRGLPLDDPIDVNVALLDKKTGEPTKLISLPGVSGTPSATLTATNDADEVLDRAGEPTGETVERTVIPLTLPSNDTPGEFVIQAQTTFRGYTAEADFDVHYESILNIDLRLTPYNADNVDRTEQSAFVYLAPFDAPEEQKTAVADFTITTWSIKPLCTPGKVRPLQSEDDVPGVGIKAYTRGGTANKIFWGPGTDVDSDQLYEVKVVAQANGMKAEGFGLLTLSSPSDFAFNRIFLRNATGGFYKDSIYADGEEISYWEVLARPEEETGSGTGTSGEEFRNAIVRPAIGGLVPSLPDGKIITMVATAVNASGLNGVDLNKIIDNVRIKTNLTGTSGRARSANARVVNGKATFQVSVNARVPEVDEQRQISQDELESNVVYDIYGITFEKPQSGVYLVLRTFCPVLINGRSVSFFGGGKELKTASPPAFIELKEPLNIT